MGNAVHTSPVQRTVYRDNWLERLVIRLFSHKMAKALGSDTRYEGYDGFVDLSQQIMEGRNAQEQRAIVAVVLKSLIPAPALWFVRTLFSPTRWVCEGNAWFACQLFEWLVGPCDWVEAEVTQPDGTGRSHRSGVHIQKCRYLEESGCVGTCINLCKVPTQTFFTESFGIPLTMTPNFEDLSCEMVFGQQPPRLEDEDCYHQPCLANRDLANPCAIATPKAPACPKIAR